MGFFDKVKEQANKAAGQAQQLKGKVEGKVEDIQEKRKVDDLLDDLGRFLYAERTGRPIPGAEAEVDRIVGQLQVLEAGGATVLTDAAASDPPADSAPPSDAAPASE